MSDNKRRRSYKFAIVLIIIGLILIMSGAYAWLTLTIKAKKTNDIVVGNLSVKLGENLSEGITINNALPMSDSEGEEQDAYSFSITNDGNVQSNYIVYLDDKDIPDGEVRMNDKFIRYNLTKNNVSSNSTFLTQTYNDDGKRVIDKGTLDVGATNTYDLRFWISDSTKNDVMSTIFSTNIRVEAEQIKE